MKADKSKIKIINDIQQQATCGLESMEILAFHEPDDRKKALMDATILTLKQITSSANLLLQLQTEETRLHRSSHTTDTDMAKDGKDELLTKIRRFTIDNLGASDFSIQVLSSFIGLSSITINLKVKALTGKTTSEYIRQIKMNEACRLLKSTEMNISEIAYTLGYNFPKFFSHHFKAEYGCLPTEFRKYINQ